MFKISDALIEAFEEEMNRDECVFIIGEEVGVSGGPYGTTKGLQNRFGKHRIIDCPISEIGFTGLAVGASFCGLKPVVDFMSWSFSLQAIDHIVNSCAKTCYMSGSKLHCPIVFRGPSGLNPGYAAQHNHEFYNIYGCIPGLKVIAPYSPADHKRLMKSSIRDENPIIFLENQYLYDLEFIQDCGMYFGFSKNEIEDEKYTDINKERNIITESNEKEELQDLSKAIVMKIGKDVTIIGISLSLLLIEKYAKNSKYDVEILNLISIRPIDMDTIIKSTKKTKRLVIVEFTWPSFSVASEISSRVYNELYGKLESKIECLNLQDIPMPYAKNLEELCIPNEKDLEKAVEKLFK